MQTKALDVKRALKALLDAMPIVTTDSIQVTFGLPGGRAIEKKWAFVGETRWLEARWATNRSREEVLAITVGFSIQLGGGTPEEAEEYLIDFAAAFEETLSDNPGLSGLCVSTQFTAKALNSWPIDGAYEAQFDTEVKAICRP